MHLPAEAVGLGHGRGFFQDGGSLGSHRVDIDVADAALVQVVPVAIGVPGGAGVAAVRVPGPEGEANAAPQLVPPLGQQPSDFELGGVGRAVVHDAQVPGIDVAAEENEAVLLAAGQIGGEGRNHGPGQVRLRDQLHGDRTSRRDAAFSRAAILTGDADGRHVRQQRGGLRRRRSPDRGDAHLVDVLVVDVDLTDRPGQARRARLARHGQPVAEDDLAPRRRSRRSQRACPAPT